MGPVTKCFVIPPNSKIQQARPCAKVHTCPGVVELVLIELVMCCRGSCGVVYLGGLVQDIGKVLKHYKNYSNLLMDFIHICCVVRYKLKYILYNSIYTVFNIYVIYKYYNHGSLFWQNCK